MAFERISGDSHLEIPCDRWTHRVPAQYRDRAPRRIKLANGGDAFLGENSPMVFGGTGQYSGRDPEEFNPMIAVDFDASVGCGPPEQRLRELDQDGLKAELLFPSNTAFKACRGIGDNNAYFAVVRAYNDYLAEEYCSVAPDRLLGVGVLPHRGVEADIAEMEHCAKIGMKTVGVGRYPGGRPYPTPEDDRFWSAALDLDMPVTIHTTLSHGHGQTFKYPRVPEGETPDDDYVLRLYRHGHPHSGALEACQMVVSGLFDRLPKLQIYWAENQVGWVPFYYEQMDMEYERNHFWAERVFGMPQLKNRPSEYLREHAYWGFFDDPLGMRLRHDVGVDRIIWGSDFPHVVTTWPNSVETIEGQLAGAPADETQRIMGDNVRAFLHL